MSAEQSIVTYKFVPEFPMYRVGDDGSVWSLHGATWKLLKPLPTNCGYVRVVLQSGGRRWRVLVHRLVLMVFVGPCPEGMEGSHSPDPTRTNNALSNLRWATRTSNVADQLAHGTRVNGERQWKARLNEKLVRQLRTEYAAGGISQHGLSRKYGIPRGTINHALSGYTWHHV